jgi:RNA polymerase sigma factor (sigma-70 family)
MKLFLRIPYQKGPTYRHRYGVILQYFLLSHSGQELKNFEKMKVLDDPKSLALFHSGDSRIFRKVFSMHENAVYGKACYFLKDKIFAQDVVWIMALKLWDQRKKLDTDGRVRAFLMTATRNLCIDELRKRNNTRIVGEEKVPESYDAVYAFTDDVEQALLRLKMEQETQGLPPRQREIVRLYLEDYSMKEIASMLKVSQSTVSTQWAAIRKTLKAALKKYRTFLLLTILLNLF